MVMIYLVFILYVMHFMVSYLLGRYYWRTSFPDSYTYNEVFLVFCTSLFPVFGILWYGGHALSAFLKTNAKTPPKWL